MAYFAYAQIKKTEGEVENVTTAENIEEAQDFLPFVDIRDNVIDMGGKYRAIVKVGCVNYFLRTDIERNIIESSFNNFLNSLRYPVTFFIQTKTISNEEMLKSLSGDVEKVLKKFPNLEAYANVYTEGISNLDAYIGTNLNKQYYVIIPFDEATEMKKLSPSERYDYAVKELHSRVNFIAEALSNCGAKTELLNTKEIIELIVSCLHRSDLSSLKAIMGQGFAELAVESTKDFALSSEDEKLEQALKEFENRLRIHISADDLPPEQKEKYNELLAYFSNYSQNKGVQNEQPKKRNLKDRIFNNKTFKKKKNENEKPQDIDLQNTVSDDISNKVPDETPDENFGKIADAQKTEDTEDEIEINRNESFQNNDYQNKEPEGVIIDLENENIQNKDKEENKNSGLESDVEFTVGGEELSEEKKEK